MAELTDRELLERAAKAFWSRDLADDLVSIRYSEADEGILYLHADNQDQNGLDREFRWNPLLEDADALQLAVKLNLHAMRSSGSHIDCYGEKAPFDQDGEDNSTWSRLADCWFSEGMQAHCESSGWPWEPDQLAATRRAIVRAAASLATEGGV